MILDVTKQLKALDNKLASLRSQFTDCPAGSLQISKNGKYYTYRLRTDGGEVRYIPANEEALARQLAFKKYLQLQIRELEEKRKALLTFQRQVAKWTGKAARYLYENEGAGRLLKDCFPIRNAPLAAWAALPPAAGASRQEMRTQKCRSGHIVRSKSERMIDNALFAARIPFRYEDPLVLGEETVYPDFTIRHPVTGEFIYWEHFGMMENPHYIRRATWALSLYANNGIWPFNNLIATFEADGHPLSDAQIDLMMAYFF